MKNYKIKSNRSISKRLKVTSNRLFLRHRAGRSHLLQKKSSKRKQSLRKTLFLQQCEISRIKSKLLYLF
uniref:50S ribosomal protein L35 n=1 Tax=Sporolithon durum TaxID=48970 RepID=A0A141SCR6_9FLOR|nr:ribosomal protein L35 [Sporolithon durum]AMK96084.1 ribosomal protein L35 [Sporolithon durum]